MAKHMVKKLLFILMVSTSFYMASAQEKSSRKIVQDAGDVLFVALPAAAGLATLFEDDKTGTWQFAKSFTLNLAVTMALKHAINKDRPKSTDGLAFPSGHTSVTFNSASFIQRRYGWKYGIPAYALASFVGYSRIKGIDERHDGWDVLAGAVVGIGSTYLFTTPYQKEHMELSFNSGEGNYLLGFKYKF